MSIMEKQRAGPVLAPAGREDRSRLSSRLMRCRWCSMRAVRSRPLARSLGVGATNLGNWVRQARIDCGEREGVTTSERAELRRENFRLRQERELLKRATAFWVRESRQ